MSTSIQRISGASAPGAPLRLSSTTRLISAREQTLTGVRGLTWVTLDNELRDIVLGSGQRTTIPPHRLVVVTSLWPDAAFEVTMSPTTAADPAPQLASARRPNRASGWQRLLRPLAAAFAAPTRRGTPA